MRTHLGSASNVCVLHIKPFCLLVDIKHTQVSALILHPGDKQALWPQSYDTGSYVVPGIPSLVTVVQQCHAIVVLAKKGTTYVLSNVG